MMVKLTVFGRGWKENAHEGLSDNYMYFLNDNYNLSNSVVFTELINW